MSVTGLKDQGLMYVVCEKVFFSSACFQTKQRKGKAGH